MLQRLSRLPWLPVILVVAFVLRAGAAAAVQQRVGRTGALCLIAGDAEGYWMLARHLAHGEDFAIYDPPRYVERMPGFPLVLAAGMKLFDENVLCLRLLLALVGTAACALVYFLGRELVDQTVGRIACLLAALSPMFSVFSVLLLSETLFATALLASLLALARVLRAGTSPRLPLSLSPCLPAIPDPAPESPTAIAPSLLAGALCGMATLVRPTWILVGPAFVVALVALSPDRRRLLMQGGMLLLGLCLVLAPWTIRNAFVTGHFVPTTLWMGPSLYDGLSPQATGDSNMQFVEDDGWYSRRDLPDFEYQADRHYRSAALEFAWNNPGRAVALGVHKLWRFANPFPNAAQFASPAIWWCVGLFEAPVLLLAIAGAWKMRGRIWLLALTACPLLYFALIHTVFVGSIRYRLPAEYALLVLTSVGGRWLEERLVHRAP